MKYAIVAVTENGVRLAAKLRSCLDVAADIYCKNGKASSETSFIFFDKMSSIMKKIFTRYDALIFFCATGIVVRMIAPYIQKKNIDPAVVVLDEQARHAISLLSGHLGGANELTQKVAVLLGSVPVITTATDVSGLKAPDSIAHELGFTVFPLKNIKPVNSALLSGAKIKYYIDKNIKHNARLQSMLSAHNISSEVIDENKLDEKTKPLIFLTDKPFQADGVLCFTRHKLTAGVGCRRGTPREQIEKCLKEACTLVNYNIDELVLITSTQVKSDEKGILAAAEKYNIPVKFWDNDALQKSITDYHLTESAFVKKQIGIGNVCEAAALAGGKNKLVLNKTKFEKVTVALSWEK